MMPDFVLLLVALSLAALAFLGLLLTPPLIRALNLQGWRPAPPPPSGIPEHPVLADRVVGAMVSARGSAEELRDRVQVPPPLPAPFLDLPVEEGSSILERMLAARGRW